MSIDPIRLGIFQSRLAAICETMGARLRRAAFSPNIRDRLDYSCALFDVAGGLLAQATHIPVHLGSMAWAMRDLAGSREWSPGEGVMLNDPYNGGTHLPDVTAIMPVFADGALIGFAVNRAHHADIGADVPGSLPLSEHLEQEGTLIPPTRVMADGRPDETVLRRLTQGMKQPRLALGDFNAQISAGVFGEQQLRQLVDGMTPARFGRLRDGLNAYAESMTRHTLAHLPEGEAWAEDVLDDDGMGTRDILLRVAVVVRGDTLKVDFSGTAGQVRGNLNCPLSVTAAGVYYVLRCLLPPETPDCAGSLAPLRLHVPDGCVLNARPPAAVAAGNVETSQRVVDVLLRALARLMPERIPAASQGTMNNVALGGADWSYYETLAGGCGASAAGPGRAAVHSHMTNTLNSPVEVLETVYPLRVRRYALRRDSGGPGRHAGGDGVVREYEFLEAAELSLITERRAHPPWGLAGGQPGRAGVNTLDGEALPGKVQLKVRPGQRLTVETPGGGGWGSPE